MERKPVSDSRSALTRREHSTLAAIQTQES